MLFQSRIFLSKPALRQPLDHDFHGDRVIVSATFGRFKSCEAIRRIPGSPLCVSTSWLTLSSAGRAQQGWKLSLIDDNGLFQSVRHKGASISIASPELFEKLRLMRPTA